MKSLTKEIDNLLNTSEIDEDQWYELTTFFKKFKDGVIIDGIYVFKSHPVNKGE